MLALGHSGPEIAEIDGPFIRVALVGGPPDPEVAEFVSLLMPATVASDVDALLITTHLLQHGWIDVTRAAPLLQRSAIETNHALARLAAATIDAEPVLTTVKGTPSASRNDSLISARNPAGTKSSWIGREPVIACHRARSPISPA
jgi:ATP-dependent DNA helicase RecG